jgi:CDGSH-type Zn-finger protein
MSETAVKITLKPNGPLRVEGLPSLETSVSLIDIDGTEFELTGKPGISLCRCGQSANKPFCDGSHAKVGFQAADPNALPKK